MNNRLQNEIATIEGNTGKLLALLLDPDNPSSASLKKIVTGKRTTMRAGIGMFPDFQSITPPIKDIFTKWEHKFRHTAPSFVAELSPVEGVISSGFGVRSDPVLEGTAFHEGLDIANKPGKPVRSVADGTVIFTGWKQLYGYTVMIDHGNGFTSVYAHLAKITTNQNCIVSDSTQIGTLGNTGKSTGPHLHFEIRKNGRCINPITAFTSREAVID